MAGYESDKTDMESLDGEKCAVCLGNIKNKSFLQCSHGFCHDCLDKVIKASKKDVICPVCRDSSSNPYVASGGMGKEFMEQVKIGLSGRKHGSITYESGASGSKLEQCREQLPKQLQTDTGVAARKYDNTDTRKKIEAEKLLSFGTQQHHRSNLSTKRKPSRSSNIQVFVRLLSDRTINLTVSPGETIDSLKTRIYENTRISTDGTLLIHEGKQLQSGYTLSHYNIRENSSIQQTARLNGGF